MRATERRTDMPPALGNTFLLPPNLSAENPSWMSLANASVQYAAATVFGKKASQLVKRAHLPSGRQPLGKGAAGMG